MPSFSFCGLFKSVAAVVCDFDFVTWLELIQVFFLWMVVLSRVCVSVMLVCWASGIVLSVALLLLGFTRTASVVCELLLVLFGCSSFVAR